MRLGRSNILSTLLMVVIAFLAILLILLPNIIDLIPNKRIKFIIEILLFILVFILIIFETYNDVKKKLYVTTKYIVAADIVIIVAFTVASYQYFIINGMANLKILLNKIYIPITAVLFFLGAILTKKFMTSDRFKKENLNQ